jgi:hypothetical protein
MPTSLHSKLALVTSSLIAERSHAGNKVKFEIYMYLPSRIHLRIAPSASLASRINRVTRDVSRASRA